MNRVPRHRPAPAKGVGQRRRRPCFELRTLDLSDPSTTQAVVELQRAAYAVEAELIGYDGIPPLHESAEDLQACHESFLGLYDGHVLLGAVSWQRLPDDTLDICRLVVAPRAHRRGLATLLLDALDQAVPARRTVVSTGTADLPARGLYEKRGFVPVDERDIAPGVTITLLERSPPPAC